MKKKVTLLLALLIAVFHSAMAEDNSSSPSEEMTRQEINELRSARGLVSLDNEFLPKGSILFGAGLSYSAHENDNYQLLVVDGIESYGYTIKATPMVAYAVATNMAVGFRATYGRSFMKMKNADLSFGDPDDGGVNLSFTDYYSITQSYSAMGIWRQYIPLGKNRRFALFNEMQFEVGGAKTKMSFDEPTKGTFSKTKSISLGAAPGMVAFATNDVAFEVSVGLLGFSYSTTQQTHNQVDEGSASAKFFNFKINLLSIGLGVAFYL
ncbi:MAG: hypothetical protein SNH88_01520 [Rikenellaceae bacterium]